MRGVDAIFLILVVHHPPLSGDMLVRATTVTISIGRNNEGGRFYLPLHVLFNISSFGCLTRVPSHSAKHGTTARLRNSRW